MEPQPPVWVFKRDGRQVPFEADKISRALFAATEALGQPDAFLARELTDGVVHFLTAESEEATPTTAQVAELVAKIVRELGQPILAEAFVEHGRHRERTSVQTVATTSQRASRELVLRFSPDTPLAEVLPACTRGYALQAVFARDIVATHEDGLLTLTGLETPCELAGCVLGRPGAVGAAAEIEGLRRFVGRYVVLDGPEHGLARAGRTEESAALDFVREMEIGLRISGLDAVVNLNVATPPSWADDLAEGPLFTEQRHSPGPGHLTTLADTLARELARPDAPTDRVRIDWHVGERDFLPGNRDRLGQMARLALEGAAISFVFDRPRRPAYLAEGIDRGHPATLLTVGVHLPRLAAQPGVNGDAEVFLQKLGSLARLALSAGVQKREFLRRLDRARADRTNGEPAVTSGFLLDRARLVVAPVGLDAVTEAFTGRGLVGGGAALDFAKRVVQRLRDVLRQDARATHLDTCLDGPFSFRLGDKTGGPFAADAAGLTAWDPAAPVKSQLRAAGPLHALAEGGTLALFVPAGQAPTAENVVEWLRAAWQQSDVARLRLVRSCPEHRQLTFNG
jgi:hypothetical protein